MDCLRSFNFSTRTNGNFTTGVKTWNTGSNNHFWSADISSLSSTYNIEGFKNINVFGIDAIGSIQTLTAAGLGGVIVNDWNIDITLNGQRPIIGGNVTAVPNSYSLSTTAVANNVFPISKYSNSIKFAEPFQSVTSIELGGTTASGFGWETSTNINLLWQFNFIVHYKYEGE
jgi:hypothetical protein